MSAWSRRQARRRAEKARQAHNRLHGVGAVSRAPQRRRSSFDGEDLGELIVDIMLALPRGVLWLIAKALD